MGNLLVIGLTGGLATGKTTVAKIFKSFGAIIIDADKIAKEIVKPNFPAWQELKEYFGPKILNDDLSINRKLLAKLIFSNEAHLKKLNEIMHPKIIHKIKQQIKNAQNSSLNRLIIIIDAPLLIEANMLSMIDKLIVVTASETTQIRRLMARNNLSKDEAKKRIYSQIPLFEKVKLADFVIDTDCSKIELKKKVKEVLKEINRKYSGGDLK